MKEIINVSTEVLKVHPRNIEFFDDIKGEEYERFKKSISEDGILSPLLVSPDMTVISGHQRLKACKDLEIKLVPIMIREDLIDEDEKLKILLAANFGRLKNDENKQRKIATEYYNLCGLKHGVHKSGDNRLSQLEIAENLGISERTLRELLEIEQKLTPEVKELINIGVITKTTASKILTKLSKEEQRELIDSIESDKKYTQSQVQEYVNKIKRLEERIVEVSQQKVKTEIITQEKDKPETLKQIADLRNQLNEKSNQYQTLFNELVEKQKVLNTAMGESTNWQLTSHCSEITKRILDFISEMAKYDYMAESFNEIPNATKVEYLRCIKAVQKWANNIISEIENTKDYIIVEGEEIK